jgi:hypothetical protein
MEALWNKLIPWKKPKMLKEGEDYEFIDSGDGKVTGIHMLQGKYEGVFYHYHQARIVEEGELARLQFGFTIVNPGSHDPDELTNDEEFSTIMGEILQTILLAKIEDEKTRNDYN